MKKLHSLFILSILALTMFVGCQMPTDGTGNGAGTEAVDSTPTETTPTDTTPTVDADETTYGFTKTVDYTVYVDGTAIPSKIKGEILNAICKKEGFVKDTDYTIEGNKVTVITGSRLYDWLSDGDNVKEIVSGGEGGNGNGGSGTGTPTETYKVNHGQDSGNYSLVFYNYKTGYTKGETVTFLIKNGDATPKAEELYLVKTYVTDADNNAVEVTYNKENHTVSFTMPDNDVMVRADFEDVVCRPFDFNSDVSQRPNRLDVDYIGKDSFRVALRFDNKEYDNLEPFGEGKFIYEFYNLESARVGSRWYFYIQLGKDYNVYDYKNPKNCKYHETPVVIYNDTMYEPVIGSNLGNRYVNLDAELNQN